MRLNLNLYLLHPTPKQARCPALGVEPHTFAAVAGALIFLELLIGAPLLRGRDRGGVGVGLGSSSSSYSSARRYLGLGLGLGLELGLGLGLGLGSSFRASHRRAVTTLRLWVRVRLTFLSAPLLRGRDRGGVGVGLGSSSSSFSSARRYYA